MAEPVLPPLRDATPRKFSFSLAPIQPLSVFTNAYAILTSREVRPLPPPDPMTLVSASDQSMEPITEPTTDHVPESSVATKPKKLSLFRRFLRWLELD